MTEPLIRFPDAVALVIETLNAHPANLATAYRKIPPTTTNPDPSEFLVISAVGGVSETFVTNAVQITVDAYARKEARAYELCDVALAIIRAEDGVIRGSRGFEFPQSLPDPATSQIRYTSTGEVRIWASSPS